MSSQSQAYEEGYCSGAYYRNPYPQGSQEYNDFERGWTQRLKRMPASWSCGGVIGHRISLAEKYCDRPAPSRAQEPVINGYARAKHK